MAQFMATATMVVHYIALAYIVFGGFLAWRWPKAIGIHVFFAGWGLAILLFPNLQCPLTAVENHFRRRLGEGDLPGGFINTYIEGHLYPEAYSTIVPPLAGVVVVASYVGAYLLWRHRRQHAGVAGADRLSTSG